ncbi:hypothetical protein GCM10010193_70000 [Kitasatospora atroaurantiaca]|uniref:Uncharacterized protein n=1 Tax=Kitasatospora atroaurantiaca TaxID=285545 RepID=A0A561EN89_9ACTN|nr:hypothetical protein [Kitasatospora atroaurantiaca]TWE17086.1 hypothetical protein FB465_2091 [Kitasatospora atroaurantiaca]
MAGDSVRVLLLQLFDAAPVVRPAELVGEHAQHRTVVERHGLVASGGPSRIARHSGFTREYIAKIRDGKGPKG